MLGSELLALTSKTQFFADTQTYLKRGVGGSKTWVPA